MKKLLIVTVTVAVMLFFVMSSSIRAEESSCLQKKDGWILRVYTEGTGPYSLSLIVLDKTGSVVPAGNILGLSVTGNPYSFEANALNPDLSISCDDYIGTVYVMHDRSGQTSLGDYRHSICPGRNPADSGRPGSFEFRQYRRLDDKDDECDRQ